MPTSFVGLLLFVVLLAPGFCYRSRRNAAQPVQNPTALRELADLVLRSVVSDLLALLLFALARSAAPGLTPDVGRLVREGAAYAKAEYASLTVWGVAMVALACAVALAGAWLAGSDLIGKARTKPLLRLVLGSASTSVQHAPAWWRVLANQPDYDVFVGCALDDGSYIDGYVYSFSAESDETADRELVLTEARIRPPDDTEMTDLQASAVIVSARRLQYMTVTYVTK